LEHAIAAGVTDDLDEDVRVIAHNERVGACARL
jgi:hypothetical protein